MKRHVHEARGWSDPTRPWVCIVCKRPIRQKPGGRWVLIAPEETP